VPVYTTEFAEFCLNESVWLEDYALFMALKDYFDKKAADEKIEGAMWCNFWDNDIALRENKALVKWKQLLKDQIMVHKTVQFFFFKQWLNLKEYANNKGIEIIGDIPIFVAHDSCDVWANRDLFLLDKKGNAVSVAGS